MAWRTAILGQYSAAWTMFFLVRAFFFQAAYRSNAGRDGDKLAISWPGGASGSFRETQRRESVQFSVGDKVVHPHYGPGSITGIDRGDLLEETDRYYVIEIPSQKLTLRMPAGKADEGGMRLAMLQSRFPRVLSMLRSRPHALPQDYRKRQAQISAQLQSGRVTQLVRVVRDLTWHRERAHLTKTDTDYLRQGHALLAGEMALASGGAVSGATKLIEATLAAAVERTRSS